MKQPQYSPIQVEHQIALAYAGTRGLLKELPMNMIKQWQIDFLSLMETGHKDTLEKIRRGELTQAEEDVLKKVAIDVVKKFVQ